MSDDQYPDPADPRSPADIAIAQDLMRSLGGGAPWVLMEQAVSATSWRSHNVPKSPDRARLDTLQAVARGADGICFFQWRQSRAGAERFHSAMLPHAGADSDVFRGVCRQGADIAALAPVAVARVEADVALVFAWDSWWAGEEPARPTTRLSTIDQLSRWHRHLWRRGITADITAPDADLSGYRVILVPHSYIVTPSFAASLAAAVDAGAQVVVGPFSGVADENAHILQGRSPALLRELVGVSGEEWGGLPDEPTPLDITGEPRAADGAYTASTLAEKLRIDDPATVVVARFAAGDLAGRPAVTRRTTGRGAAAYLGAVVSDALLSQVLDAALDAAGVVGVLPGLAELPEGIEAVRRGDHLFLLNRSDREVRIDLAGRHIDLLTTEVADGAVLVPPVGARVVTPVLPE